MNRKMPVLIALAIVVIAVMLAGWYFVGKFINRTASLEKVTATSTVAEFPITFHTTPVFADFLFDRGFWKSGGVHINRKKGETVSKIVITLQDKADYHGLRELLLPVNMDSSITKSSDAKSNIYTLNLFIDTEYVKKYSKEQFERVLFQSVLSQMYLDTSAKIPSHAEKLKLKEQLAALVDSPGANPFDVRATK